MESKKQLLLILGVAFCAVFVYGALRIFVADDESLIRRVVYSEVLNAERQNIPKCGEFVSEGYSDQYGNTKQALLDRATRILKRLRQLKVVIKQLRIDVKDFKAEGNIGFTCYFKKAQALDEKKYYDHGKLKVLFRKETGRWKIYEIGYTGSSELLFSQGVA